MWFGVVTLFPRMIDTLVEFGVLGRAQRRGLLQVETWNPRDYARNQHRNVDDRPYGGGPGMLMQVQPLQDAIHQAKIAAGGAARVIYLSPQGRVLNHSGVRELATRERLILVSGRYEGIDERLIESEIDEEWSIGDFVLTGGELPALALIDAVSRFIPSVLGHELSVCEDSFATGLLDCPHYTRPEVSNGLAVPKVLLSGDHEEISRWRRKQSLGRTWQRRPDLLEKRALTPEEQSLLRDFIEEQNE